MLEKSPLTLNHRPEKSQPAPAAEHRIRPNNGLKCLCRAALRDDEERNSSGLSDRRLSSRSYILFQAEVNILQKFLSPSLPPKAGSCRQKREVAIFPENRCGFR